MNFLKYAMKLVRDSDFRFNFLAERGFYNKMGDEEYLRRKFYHKTGRKLNFHDPKTFNEKLQWLKLNDRKDIYTTMVDKYAVKEYVANKIGKEYIIPTLGVYDKFDDIDFDKLPNQFVIKCTHDSGGLAIIKDKSKMDRRAVRKKINKSLKREYYYSGREWPYKNVKPRILIEKYMEDKKDGELRDYKLFCFGGMPRVILVCSERFSGAGLKETWFDKEWNLLPMTEGGHGIDRNIKKPKNFGEMMILAQKLSVGIPFVRVDFYEINGKVFFGEITFYPCSGFEKFTPENWNEKLGNLIDLSLANGEGC